MTLDAEMKLNRVKRNRLNEMKERLEASLVKITTNYEASGGGGKKATIDDKLGRIEELEERIKELDLDYNSMNDELDRQISILQEANERDRTIYLQYLKGYSNAKLQVLHGIGERQIQRIIKKIKEEL